MRGLLVTSHLAPGVARPSRYFKIWVLALLASGIVATALGAYYINATGEAHRAFVVTAQSLRFYVFVGVYLVLDAVLGLFAAMAPLQRKRLLYAYVGLTALIIFTMLIVSIWLWTRTLNINNYYRWMWRDEWPDEIKLLFEDQHSCCGYLSRHDAPVSSSPSCRDESIENGCMYPVIFYAQHCHRYIYAGLATFCLIGLCCITTGVLLILECSDEFRMRRSTSHSRQKRPASKSIDYSQQRLSPTSMMNQSHLRTY
ncbi:hypothetical protein GGF46_005038 [Coemansia sp. RSA 552]|nr:hypothetical protein GGF46_005038 [Coemansia sp. RSA 552]